MADYQEHSEHLHPKVYLIDCFDREASKADFTTVYDVATLTDPAGTSNITTTVSHNTLTTGAATGNRAGTRIEGAVVERAREYFAEIRVSLTQILDTEFRFGFYKDADEYCYIEFDKSANDNWRLHIEDTTAAEFATEVYGPVATDTHYFLRLWLDPDGTPHWAVGTDIKNMLELGITGVANKLTADPHYCEYLIKTEEDVAKVAEIDYLETIKNK